MPSSSPRHNRGTITSYQHYTDSSNTHTKLQHQISIFRKREYRVVGYLPDTQYHDVNPSCRRINTLTSPDIMCGICKVLLSSTIATFRRYPHAHMAQLDIDSRGSDNPTTANRQPTNQYATQSRVPLSSIVTSFIHHHNMPVLVKNPTTA